MKKLQSQYQMAVCVFIFLIITSMTVFAQGNVVLVTTVADNCLSPTPNGGTYTPSGTLNGKTQYVKGNNLRIVWTGNQWSVQGDDPQIGGVNWVTGWHNVSNTAKPPGECWVADFGCFPITLTGDVAACPALAVHFGAVTTTTQQGGNRVDWSTFTEQNSSEFIVERSSNGLSFQLLGSVPASGNSVVTKQYHFMDNKPLQGSNYYRVTEVEKDGKKQYSAIVLAVSGKAVQPYIYPSPAKEKIIIYNAPQGSTIKIFNASGVLAHKVVATSKTQAVDVSGFAPGRYFVQIANQAGSLTLPLIVTR
jgi:hypothetical protein